MADAELGQVRLDHGQHGLQRGAPHDGEPLALGQTEKRGAVLIGERAPDGLEIVAGIEAFRDRADVLAKRLAVTEEGRAREHVHLGARVVDIIFARDGVAGEGEQGGERIAEHGAAAMADMHRSGRVGRHIFDVHRLAFAQRASAITRALLEHHAQHARPEGMAPRSD